MAQAHRLPYGRIFWSVVALQLVLWLVPFGGLLLYPFTVLATWVHELGHAGAMLLVGGRPEDVKLFFNASGLASGGGYEGAGAQALVSAGGLLGAPLAGFAMLLASATPRGAVAALATLTGGLAVALVLLMGNGPGWILGLAIIAGLAFGSWRLDRERRFAFAQLVALQLLLSVWSDWGYLFMETAYIGAEQRPSDVENIARALGGTYWLWGAIIGALDIALLFGAYRFVRWRLARDEAPPALAR